MAIAYEKNTDLVFDTGILRKAATEYANVAEELRNMAERLDSLIQALKDQGWTTPTGTAVYEMTNVNWKNNIEKYAALLCTLESILNEAAGQYEDLMANHVRETQLHISN